MIALTANRIPNFAGVALVDILANGVAVLIIVVVLSIAERQEQEKQITERVKEVSAVMTREFSTSLVLNRLAASSPARLHDYENSELDQYWDPYLLPIIEFHNDAVRDPYSGQIWTRTELLEKPNSFDDFLFNLEPDQALRLRGDIYDVGTYYLVNSQLRDYGFEIRHWHFIGSIPGKGSILNCPPDILAQDCVTLGSNQSAVSSSELSALLGQQQENDRSQQSGEGGSSWPPNSLNEQMDSESGSTGQLPNGVNLGSQSAGNPSQSRWGNFPDAESTRQRGSGSGSGQPGQPEGENSISFRLADSREPGDLENAIQLDMGDPSLEALLAGLISYIDELQKNYDNHISLDPLLQNFALILNAAVQNPPELTPTQTQVVEDLALIMRSRQDVGTPEVENEPIFIDAFEDPHSMYALLRLIPNRLLFNAQTNTAGKPWAEDIEREVAPRLNINGHPGIWRGSQILLHRGSVLMVVPDQPADIIPKWRAVVYIASGLDDFIVGFLYSTIDNQGQLNILGESNQVRIGSLNLIQPAEQSAFGVRSWLFAFYILLGLSFVGLLFFWRPNLRPARR